MGRPIENDAFEMVNVLDLLKWVFLSKIFFNFGMIFTRYQLTCPQPLAILNSTCHCRSSRMVQSRLKPMLLWKQPKRTGFVGWKLRGDWGAPKWLGMFFKDPIDSMCNLFDTFLNQNRPQTNQVGYVSSMDLFLVVHIDRWDRWPHSIGQLDGTDERDDGRSAWWAVAGGRQRGQTIQSQGDMCCVRA